MSTQIRIRRKELESAIKRLLEEKEKKNFTESVELIIATQGLNVSKPENRIRETIVLPNQPPKTMKVCVFADGRVKEAAEKAGADRVIDSSELSALADDRSAVKEMAREYDFFLAQARMMGDVGKTLGFALGPKGKAPDVVTPQSDLEKEITDRKRAVRVYLRNNPEANCSIGQETMSAEELAENATTVISLFREALGRRGRLRNVFIKTTMSSPVKVAG
jgi:large subunit ribosomal protein L1